MPVRKVTHEADEGEVTLTAPEALPEPNEN